MSTPNTSTKRKRACLCANSRDCDSCLHCEPFGITSVHCIFGNTEEQRKTFDPEQNEFFENRIRPVLVEQCYKCHSAEANKLQGGLSLDSRQGLLDGGDSGPTVVIGSPDKSLLIECAETRIV